MDIELSKQMLRKLKRMIGFDAQIHPTNPNDLDLSDSSDSMEDIDNDNNTEQNNTEIANQLEYEIIRIQDTDDTLREVQTICVKCGEDFTQDVLDLETEAIKIKVCSPTSRNKRHCENTDRSNTLLSSEGLCLECEITTYPQRFHGCAFCRRPLRDLFACTTCRMGFAEWIKDVIPPETLVLKSVREQANNIVTGVIESGYIENREFLFRESQLMCRWPGFYAGTLNINQDGSRNDQWLPTWIIPGEVEIPNEAKGLSISTDLTKIAQFKMFELKLTEILEHNGINLFNNVQIDVKNFKSKNIREINPYDLTILS